MKFIVAMVMLLAALASAYHSIEKLRRDGLHLHPFPRVGRASRNTWNVPVAEFEELENRLYAFPRTGRNAMPASPREFNPVAVRRTDSPGMWFGPRLGRSFKSDDELSIHSENDISDPEQTDPLQEERRKRETLN